MVKQITLNASHPQVDLFAVVEKKMEIVVHSQFPIVEVQTLISPFHLNFNLHFPYHGLNTYINRIYS